MKQIDRIVLLEHLNSAATDLFDRGGVVPAGVLVILRDEIEAGKFDAPDTAEPVSNAEKKFMNNFACMYEMERIERVLDSLDNKVFKSLSAYADAEHFLRFARDEIRRLKVENQSIQQERDKLIEGLKFIRDNTWSESFEDARKDAIETLASIGVGEERT